MRKLTADKKTCYVVAFAVMAALLLAFLIPAVFVRWSVALILLIAAGVVYAFVKKRSILSFYKKQVTLLLLVTVCLYLVLYYVMGLYFGFGIAYRSLSFLSFVELILPIAIIILTSEVIRSILLAQNSQLASAASYCICVFAELLIAGGIHYLTSAYVLMDFFGMTVFPAITANALYHYVSKRYGAIPNAIYRLILTLYVYIIPFVPDVPRIITAFLLLFLPLVVYLFLSLLYEKKTRTATEKKSKWRYVFRGMGVVAVTAVIMLLSCQFRYGIIVVVSPSMAGEINTGDAVVFESYEHCRSVKENDIIVFSKNGNDNIVHRVIKVQEFDGQTQYITKGDANEDPDAGFITDDQIVGIVRFKVLYVGYPSLWLHQILK